MEPKRDGANTKPYPMVAFVNATETWGGIKTWMLDLALYLQHNGWPVMLVCRRGDRLAKLAQTKGLVCREVWFGPDYNPLLIAWLWWQFRRSGARIVVTNTSKCLRTGGIAGKLAGALHINRLGSYGDIRDRPKTRIDYALWVDRVIVCSQHLAAAFAKWSWLQGKIQVFHNGTSIPNPVVKPDLNTTPRPPLNIVMIAMLSRRKQVDRVIDVLGQLRHLPWHLHIGGAGPEAQALANLVRNQDLTHRITFHGMVHPADLLGTAHLGILYSSEEAFGTAIIEYMAHGCAVLASKTGGAEEIFRKAHAHTFGKLVDPHNTNELFEALNTCLENPDLIGQWGVAGREAALKCFSAQASFGALADFLARCTKR